MAVRRGIWRLLLAAVVLTVISGFQAVGLDGWDLYQTRTLQDRTGESLPYRLLMPRRYNSHKAYPLILFLHGDGERGIDNTAQLRNGGDLFLKSDLRHLFPAFVVFPQMPANAQWVDVPMDTTPSMKYPQAEAKSLRLAVALVAQLRDDYRIDSRRIYIMGVSDGAFGVWDALIRHPNLFAAGISIAGGADPAQAVAVEKTPIWAFHSAADTTVYLPIEKKMIEALQARKAPNLRYTEYSDQDHGQTFGMAFGEKDLLPWLFQQKGPAPARRDSALTRLSRRLRHAFSFGSRAAHHGVSKMRR